MGMLRGLMTERPWLRSLFLFVVGSLLVLGVLVGVGSASAILAVLASWGGFDIKLGQLEFFEYEILDSGGWATIYGSGVFYLAIFAGLINALRPLFSARRGMAMTGRD
ncbi:MAG: hypothetical protein OXR64_14635 [Chloroflexota bacterium]|nr:hypothetical protein [Chloroflexota bacterium]MDE2921069.1 hypothetical protein [Chloroflexota bacterium]